MRTTFFCKLTVTTGRGAERQEVCVARNLEAVDRVDAVDKLFLWAEDGLKLYDFIHDQNADVRVRYEATLGAASMPSVSGS